MEMLPLPRLDKLWNDVVLYYMQEQQRHKSLFYIGIHGCDHIYRVWSNVKVIKNNNDSDERVNYELLQAAAILHDIGYLDAASLNHSEEHVKKSVLMSREFLQTPLFTEEETETIQKIISAHHNDQYNQMSLEQKMLLVADQLDLLGLDGTLREFIRASTKYQDRDEMAVEILKKSRRRYTKLLELKIGEKLIVEKWRQSESYLLQIINTGHRRTLIQNGE
jgi:HD superfamily phosphodiesterase